jgi:hypothetical protein
MSYFRTIFSSEANFKYKAIAAIPWFLILTISWLSVTNKQSDWSENRCNNKLSKSGFFLQHLGVMNYIKRFL